jgi:hypothetical protein
MDRLGFFIGLVALAVSLFADVPRYVLWFGIICLIWGGLALLRAYIKPLAFLWNVINGRFPLLMILEMARKQSPDTDGTKLLGCVEELARSGQITIYGEHGSSRHLAPIPGDYFKTHSLSWFLDELNTLNPMRAYDTEWLIPLSQVNQNLGLAGQIRNWAGFEFFGRS